MSKRINRRAVGLMMNGMDLVTIMSEGNPGAMRVLVELIQKDQMMGMLDILHLDDMNIRGCQVWLGYKDVCKYDLDVFIEKLRKRDTEMINYINQQYTEEQAVTHGASFER